MKFLIPSTCILFVVLALANPIKAACLFGGGIAGQNASYQYAVAYISAIISADIGLKKLSHVAKSIQPAENDADALAAFSKAMQDYELAARDFDCAASLVQRQENFTMRTLNEMDRTQIELARHIAMMAKTLYQRLAKETRAIAALLLGRMKGSASDIEFAVRGAKIFTELDDIPREIFSITPVMVHLLVDSRPDSENRRSRLRITEKERDDLILMLDREFAGREGWRHRKGGPAMEAAGGMIREWLATRSHTPAR